MWFGLGGAYSAVYATEVSREEALIYTTEQTEKMKVKEAQAQYGGDIVQAVRAIATQERQEDKR